MFPHQSKADMTEEFDEHVVVDASRALSKDDLARLRSDIHDDEVHEACILLHRRKAYFDLTGKPCNNQATEAVNIVVKSLEETTKALRTTRSELLELKLLLEEARRRETSMKAELDARKGAAKLLQNKVKKMMQHMGTKDDCLAQARQSAKEEKDAFALIVQEMKTRDDEELQSLKEKCAKYEAEKELVDPRQP